jgi:hypothetical protein
MKTSPYVFCRKKVTAHYACFVEIFSFYERYADVFIYVNYKNNEAKQNKFYFSILIMTIQLNDNKTFINYFSIDS